MTHGVKEPTANCPEGVQQGISQVIRRWQNIWMTRLWQTTKIYLIMLIYMNQQILIDAFFGAVLVGLFSYFASIYDSHPSYLNITAYLWGVPLFYFYLVYITWQKSREAMFSFTRHAVVGTALTVLVMLITLYMTNQSLSTIVAVNIALLILFIAVYFYFELYKL